MYQYLEDIEGKRIFIRPIKITKYIYSEFSIFNSFKESIIFLWNIKLDLFINSFKHMIVALINEIIIRNFNKILVRKKELSDMTFKYLSLSSL